MRSYQTARSLHSFLEFLFWMGVICGLLIALAGAAAGARSFGGGGLLGAGPGLVMIAFCLLGVSNVQNARAAVDSAEYGQQMLKVARDQLEISKQALRGSGIAVAGFTERAKRSSDGGRAEPPLQAGYGAKERSAGNGVEYLKDDGSELIYRGARAVQTEHGYVLEGTTKPLYPLLADFKLAIDMQLDQPTGFARVKPLPITSASADNDPEVEAGRKDGELEYAGQKVIVQAGRYLHNGKLFTTWQAVQKHLDAAL